MKFFILGVLLAAGGAVMPFLMVVGAVEPSWILCFGSYAGTVLGCGLGIVSMVSRWRGDTSNGT